MTDQPITERQMQEGVTGEHPDARVDPYNPDNAEEQTDGDYLGQTDDLDDSELPEPETDSYNVEWDPEEQP